MKTVALCNSCMPDVAVGSYFDEFSIDGETFTIALLDAKDSDFSKFFNPHSVVVRISAFSCNFHDHSLAHLFYEQCRQLSGNQKYFYSPIGSEFVGEVVEVGSEVRHFHVGDRVMPDHCYPYKSNGAVGGIVTNFASQRLQLYSEEHLIKVPQEMPDEVAAGFSLSALTAYSMVRKGAVREGDNVLITTVTSNTSLAILDALKDSGANIYGMSHRASSLRESMKGLGMKDVFAPDFLHSDTQDKSMRELPFWDVIFDPFIDLYFANLCSHFNFNARYVYCGMYKQNKLYGRCVIENNVMQLYHACITRNVSVIGNCLGNHEDLLRAIEDYKNGNFRILIDSVYTGKQIVDFFNRTFIDEQRIGKVIYKYE